MADFVHSVSARILLYCMYSLQCFFAFSALTLLVGWQEGHLGCKNWVVRYWRGYLSGSKCKWFAYGPARHDMTYSVLKVPLNPNQPTYGPADATATPVISCSSKIQNGLSCWCRLSQVVLEKSPLNGCSGSSSSSWIFICCYPPASLLSCSAWTISSSSTNQWQFALSVDACKV